MNEPTPILMDVDQRAGLPFPRSLPEFQRLFPGDAACAEYLEKVRWGDGFVCPHCGVVFANGIWLDFDVGVLSSLRLSDILPTIRMSIYASFSSTKASLRLRV